MLSKHELIVVFIILSAEKRECGNSKRAKTVNFPACEVADCSGAGFGKLP